MQIERTDQFTETYDMLNEAQRAAVDTIDGPVMVVAGPGSGKTQVLAARIANILLKTDTNPSSILALTFTESAAKNMRQRLVQMIGKTAYYVQINTFHSFCTEVIQQNPELFPIDPGSEPLSDFERYRFFESVIDDIELDVLKPMNSTYFYLKTIMGAVSNLKREGVLPDNFQDIVEDEAHSLEMEREDLTKTKLKKREKNLDKQRELLECYRLYQERLRAARRFDFDDMISLVVEAFRTQELLLREYQEKLHYFLVDEYQDTNTAQNQVVDLLASFWGEQANVFVVGDPNQSIYRFQGASLENVASFLERYTQATVVTLKRGYRCPQPVYDAAYRVITENKLTDLSLGDTEVSFATQLTNPNDNRDPESSDNSPISLYAAPVQTLEAVYVAEEIERLIEEGVDPTEIAILFRNNRDAELIQDALDKWHIRSELDGGEPLFDAEPIQQLVTMLRVIAEIRDGEDAHDLFEVTQYDWTQVDALLAMKATRAAGKAKISLLELILSGYEVFDKYNIGPVVSKEKFEELQSFVSRLQEFGNKDATMSLPKWFETVVKESNYLKWIVHHPFSAERLHLVNSLFREVKSLSQSQRRFKLQSFIDAIDTMHEHGVQVSVEDLNVKSDAVTLSTVHKAKGQEWEHVFLLHCVDGKWGNVWNRELLPLPDGLLPHTDVDDKERNEDERRLFYVALTRAKKQLHITYPETIVDGARTKEAVPSMFIEEIGREHISQDTAEGLIENSEKHLERLLQPANPAPPDVSMEEYFKSVVEDFRLSVTALNTYLRDPEDFLYNHVLRVPRAKPAHLSFGTAVHSALEKFYTSWEKNESKPAAEKLIQDFKNSLEREVMTEEEMAKRLAHGEEVLQQYWEELSPVQLMDTEKFIGYGWSTAVMEDDIHLVGQIDRIDWLDESQKKVRLVDYKTGKPKSQNYILGQTKSAGLSEREQELPEAIQGPYKRQLLFYKLLTDLDQSFTPTATTGTFEFVEPRQSGNFASWSFELPQEEIDMLKELIREVMGEIRELRFLERED